MQITKQRLKQLIMEEQKKIVIESRIRELKPNVLDTLLNEAIRILLSEGQSASKLKKAALILGVSTEALNSALSPVTNEGMFGAAPKKMKSIGAALAKKMAGAKALEPYFAKLAEQDDFQKAQFVSLIANKIGLDLHTAASKLKATQKTVGAVEDPVPEEPQVA